MAHLMSAIVLAFTVFAVSRCATSGSGSDLLNANGTSRYQMIVFSAPWCENCEPFIRGLNGRMAQRYDLSSGRLSAEVHVVTGKKKFEKPTGAVAAEYVEVLGVPFLPVADFWKTGGYAQYYGNESLNIPSVVILSDSGDEKIFTAGSSIDEVLSYLDAFLR